MWQYDPYHNSIITAGNGGTKPTKAAFTIFYNQGTEKYELEQTLQPDEQMWIDIGKLVREHVLDKNGKTLPHDLTMGSYEFRDLMNVPIGTLFEGKVIYDKTYGHVAYGCAGCCGNGAAYLFYNPLGIPFGPGAGNGVNAPDNCGGVDNVSSSFFGNWTTASTSTATVDYYATHSAVAVGSTTSSTYGPLPRTLRFSCPLYQQGASGGDNVVNCTVPAGETTAVAGSINSTETQFNQAISDTAGDSFDGNQINEGDAATAQDTCWWGPTSAIPKTTGVTGGPPWTVAGDDVPGQHNHWGFDTVGWTPSAVQYYRAQAPGHGIAIPCGSTMYQSLQIMCSSGVWWTYTPPSTGNKLTATIEQTDVVNCRYDMNNSACQTITY